MTERCSGLAPCCSPCSPWGSASSGSCLGSGILCSQHRHTNQNVVLTRSQVIHTHLGIAGGQGPESPGGLVKPLAGPAPGSHPAGLGWDQREHTHPGGCCLPPLGTSLGEPQVSPGVGAVCLLPQPRLYEQRVVFVFFLMVEENMKQ